MTLLSFASILLTFYQHWYTNTKDLFTELFVIRYLCTQNKTTNLLIAKLLFSVATRAAYGDARTEETFFKQLVSCNVELQLHETGALIFIAKRANAFAKFQETTAADYPT